MEERVLSGCKHGWSASQPTSRRQGRSFRLMESTSAYLWCRECDQNFTENHVAFAFSGTRWAPVVLGTPAQAPTLNLLEPLSLSFNHM